MNSSRISIGSTMCGIILENGEDCNGTVSADHGLNLCMAHLKEAFEVYRRTVDIEPAPKAIQACAICGHGGAHPGTTGFMCALCGGKTPDFTGKPVASYEYVEKQQVERLKTKTHPAVVYYMLFGDRIKIGTTRDILKRMQSVPNDRVLATEPGDFHLEAVRHNEFKSARIKGEWFRQSPELLAHIEVLQKNW